MEQSEKEAMVKMAAEVATKAHAPYSNFPVGAVLRTPEGVLYSGCNVENASYGLTICAERAAVFKAVSEVAKTFTHLALSVRGGGPPCGACRQVLREFALDLEIFLGDEHGQMIREVRLRDLLPDSFGPESLETC